MSALVMGLVWELQETAEFGRAEKYVLLAYADHADSAGKNIYPSVDLVARKTFYKERAVQITTHNLEKMGFLLPDGMGPRGTNRWRIPIIFLSDGGAKIAPVQNAVLKNAPEGNAPEENAPEPSVVVNKPVVIVIGGDIFKMYEQEFGALTPMIADAIKDAEKTYPADWIPEAMQIAVGRNKRNWKYVEGILKNCKAAGKRPSLNKLEAKHGNTRTSSKTSTKPKQSTGTSDYSSADRAAAEIIRKRQQGAAVR